MRTTPHRRLTADLQRRKRKIPMPANVKEEVARRVEKLPSDAPWDDLMYEIYVRQAIDSGLVDSDAGEVVSVETVRRDFGLSK